MRKQSKGLEGYLDSDDFKDLKFYVIVRGKGKPIEALLELTGREKRKCGYRCRFSRKWREEENRQGGL